MCKVFQVQRSLQEILSPTENVAPDVAQFFSLHVFDFVKSPYNTVSQSSKTLGRALLSELYLLPDQTVFCQCFRIVVKESFFFTDEKRQQILNLF